MHLKKNNNSQDLKYRAHSSSFISTFSAIGILYFSNRKKWRTLLTFNVLKLGIHASVTFHTARAVGEIAVRNNTAIFIFRRQADSNRQSRVSIRCFLASSSFPSKVFFTRPRGCLKCDEKRKGKGEGDE
ncbi:hypothetical protein CEXT_762781 [Caerostris extrusa]|uniref:Uncharacterized protein n=1 Tax=Caerostris extrusa TaxID=172846 RepID=A0AAV4NUH3_CAEEX|nr:hypothetical protein CEXT_762781 [Caerostris extrusa]